MSTLSVIVPVYNAEEHLEKCVNSIINQTYKDLEVILVNDGSTDNSSAICDALAAKDDRIKVIHKENGGVSSARNKGLDFVTGKYITFVDSDDWLDISAYEKSINEIETNSLDLLIFGYSAIYPTHKDDFLMDCTLFTRNEYKSNISEYITSGVGFNSACNKVYSSHIINTHNLRFDQNLQINEDSVFNCKYFTFAHKIKCIPDIFYYYNQMSSNTTGKGRIDYIHQGKIYSQAIIDAVQSKGLYTFASEAIKTWYQSMLYIHLMFILLPNPAITDAQRIVALKALYNSVDDVLLKNHLATIPGIKYIIFYNLYRFRLSRVLIWCVKVQSSISQR